MNKKKLVLVFLLTSFVTGYSKDLLNFTNRDTVVQSLYKKRGSLSALNQETRNLYIQILRENKALLKDTIINQTDFFNNFDLLKGAVGLWVGAKCFYHTSLPLFMALYGHSLSSENTYVSPAAAKRIEKLNIGKTLASSACVLSTAFSAWIFTVSAHYFYKGWYKKEIALAELEKIEELLGELEGTKKLF
jgi:hypothetical protein